jgi:polyferredoxin
MAAGMKLPVEPGTADPLRQAPLRPATALGLSAHDHKPAKRTVPRKQFMRRTHRDDSQQLRLGVQLAFLALNFWIGVQFYQWVRWAETAGRTAAVQRPPGVESWLPIAGLMELKCVVLTRQWPVVHPAGLFLISAFLLISFLLRKSFCSWLCPVGTLSEYLWKLGRFTFGRNFGPPHKQKQLRPWTVLDVLLRGTKYLLLGFFAYAVAMMPAAAIAGFLGGPYGLIVDVRMLDFFRFLGGTAAFVLLALIVASVFVQNFWCRYLCPYGALMGLVSMFSPLRIRRNQAACIDCGNCAKACPSALPVDKLVQIRSAECTACLECVAVCPAQDALALSHVFARQTVPVCTPGLAAINGEAIQPAERTHGIIGRLKGIPAWAVAAAIGVLFFGFVGYAKQSGHWQTRLPQQVYFQLVPQASDVQHP